MSFLVKNLALLCLWIGWVASGCALLFAADTKLEFFEQKIRPVLVSHCYECHSAEAAAKGKLKAGLAVDTRAGLLKGGESGPSLQPGKPAESLLIDALKHSGLEMPPTQKLPPQVIADFERWIADGASDPREGAAVQGKRGLSLEAGRKFWSFVSPRETPTPLIRQRDWPADPLDAFILAKIEAQQLTPAVDAAPQALVRRLYFDLIGLPPTPAESAAFLESYQSEPQAALAELIDDLLASSHFGERWGRHWLDSARYADSNGRDRNVFYYHAWRYRNYVIDAFNRDLPYDQFIREQIAGDLLPAESPAERDRQRIATGFLVLGPKAFEEQKPEIFRMDVIDDQIEIVGRAVLGISVGCARCHDHKFDPIPTADYYALAGIFRSTQPLYGYGPTGIKATAYAHTDLQPIGADAERLGPAGLAYFSRIHELTLAQNVARSDRYRVVRRVSAAKLDQQKPGADQVKFEAEISRMEAEIKEWDVKVNAHEAALQTAQDSPPPMPGWAMGVREREQPEDSRIHIRGDTLNLGDVVPRGLLQVLSPPKASALNTLGSGRLELAEQLASSSNPLTARVYVNRVWGRLFGRALVATPDDFGVNGARPTHPELLDHLALRFMRDGWSTKRLIRALVLSRTYRQASGEATAAAERDPDNVYFARMQPRRLEAEALRDAIMQVAGTLETKPPVGQPFLEKFNPYRENEYRTFKPLFTPEQIDLPHRSVYLPVVRGVLPDLFQLFDFASPDRSTPLREESIVPAQSLFFMNSPWVIAQARSLADLLISAKNVGDAERVQMLYRSAFAREPSEQEAARALQYLSRGELLLPNPKTKTPASVAQPPLDSQRLERWTSFCQILFATAEFRYLP